MRQVKAVQSLDTHTHTQADHNANLGSVCVGVKYFPRKCFTYFFDVWLYKCQWYIKPNMLDSNLFLEIQKIIIPAVFSIGKTKKGFCPQEHLRSLPF